MTNLHISFSQNKIYPYLALLKNRELNFDNYDRILRREVTEEEKVKMLECARAYASVYNLYTLNCDTVTGKIIGLIDVEFLLCQEDMTKTTPNQSYFVRRMLLMNRWEEIKIGKISFKELTLASPYYYYIFSTMVKRCLS